MNEFINLIKHGVVLRQFSTDFFSLNILSGIVTIQDRESRRIVFIASPNYYDFIEVERYETESDA